MQLYRIALFYTFFKATQKLSSVLVLDDSGDKRFGFILIRKAVYSLPTFARRASV